MSQTLGASTGDQEGNGSDGSNGADRNVEVLQALGLGLKNYFRFTGRSSRGACWWWFVWMALYTVLSLIVFAAFGNRIIGGLVEVLVEAGFPLPDNGATVTPDAAQGTPATAQTGTATSANGTTAATGGETTTPAQTGPQSGADPGAADGITTAAQEIPEASPAFLAIPALLLLVSILLIVPTLTVKIRRLHDTGLSGWWIFLNLIPLVGFLILLVLYARAPSAGQNRYGRFVEAGRD